MLKVPWAPITHKEVKMKITKRQLRRIIKEEISSAVNERGRGNPPPPRESNWSEFANEMNIGELDLDAIAYDLGFRDFHDMDQSISPRVLANRDPQSFVTAVQDSSMAAVNMAHDQVMAAALGDESWI